MDIGTKFATFSYCSKYAIVDYKEIIKKDCPIQLVCLVVWVCTELLIFLDDVLAENQDI